MYVPRGLFFFFFNDPATPETSPLPLPAALPIWVGPAALGWHVNVTGARAVLVPPPDSSEHYFIERGFACRARPDGGLGMFRVVHPAWAVRQVLAVDYRFDFGSLYGAEWEFLNRARPASVVFAVGSEVAVYAPTDSRETRDAAAPP